MKKQEYGTTTFNKREKTMKHIRRFLLALAFASCAFGQDIPSTTFNTVTISADAIQSNLGDGLLFHVSDTIPVPYVRLTLKMQNGHSITQLVANTKPVNMVFVLTSALVNSVEVQELVGGNLPFIIGVFVGPPKQ
jgi:hypothetical protein